MADECVSVVVADYRLPISLKSLLHRVCVISACFISLCANTARPFLSKFVDELLSNSFRRPRRLRAEQFTGQRHIIVFCAYLKVMQLQKRRRIKVFMKKTVLRYRKKKKRENIRKRNKETANWKRFQCMHETPIAAYTQRLSAKTGGHSHVASMDTTRNCLGSWRFHDSSSEHPLSSLNVTDLICVLTTANSFSRWFCRSD